MKHATYSSRTRKCRRPRVGNRPFWYVAALAIVTTALGSKTFRFLLSLSLTFRTESNEPDSTTEFQPSTTSSSSRLLLPPRLELLHIPRTGGTALEVYAAHHNITWGACHFEFIWKRRATNVLRHCPESLLYTKSVETRVPLWHYPIDLLFSKQTRVHQNSSNKINSTPAVMSDPYDNLMDATLRQRPKHFFAVLRNPYTRLISLFHKQHQRCSHSQPFFNQWIQDELHLAIKYGGSSNDCAAMPQYRYVYGATTGPTSTDSQQQQSQRVVQHMLHFENLRVELAELMRVFYPDKSPLPLLSRDRVISTKNCKDKMQIRDFSNETLHLIHRYYQRDFELGGYDMISITES